MSQDNDPSGGRPRGFWNLAERDPERVAIRTENGVTRSFGELRLRANRIANALVALGLRRGDAVAALLPNDPSYVEWFLATQQTGLYFTPLNWHLGAGEIVEVLRDCRPGIFVAHAAHGRTAIEAAAQASLGRDRCVSVGDLEGFENVERWLDGVTDSPPAHPIRGTIMLYTGGTTGRPKGVRRPLGEENPYEVSRTTIGLVRAFHLDPEEGVNLTVCPLYHAGPTAYFDPTLQAGYTQVLMRRFDPERLLATIERERVTSVYLVPTMFHRLLALPEATKARYDLRSLRMVAHAAAPCPVTVKRRMLDWWAPVIWETYGGTEGAATIASPEEWLARPGTVGRAIRGVTLRILRDDGTECPPGEPGTVYIDYGKRLFRYHGDESETAKAFSGTAYTLGDVGYLDSDDYLFLVDRKKDMIISGGVNIYPAEIEAVLLEHPAVADAAVIGVPNEEWGEQVTAFIELRADAAIPSDLPGDIIRHCRERLAHYKCPRAVEVRERLPRSDNGKLYKRQLRGEVREKK